MEMKAVELFSGIGGFNQAASRCGIKIVAAFDQDSIANEVYAVNHGLKPICRNLDSVRGGEIPQAELWWMSPPCTPYTIRGAQRDEKDRRAQSLLNLITIILREKPKIVVIENVLHFGRSTVLKKFKHGLAQEGYEYSEIILCPTQFGIPMRRPRLFIWATTSKITQPAKLSEPIPSVDDIFFQPLTDFLIGEPSEELKIDKSILERYGAVLNIIDPSKPEQKAICFTAGYGKCFKASGSLLLMPDGSVRRFAPGEILKLMGFPDHFRMPESVSLAKQWKLLGNSLELRSVLFVLRLIQDSLASGDY
jgi:site-specific DNA-cytosine methylase